jgi:hypothetical protein
MNRIILALPLLAMVGGCASSYTAERAGVPYHVFRGYHLECVKQAQLHGGYRGTADRNSMEQATAFALGGVSVVGAIPGLVAYNLAEPQPKGNPVYRQCMADNGVAPKG